MFRAPFRQLGLLYIYFMSKDSKQMFRTGILITLTEVQIALDEQYKENQ